MSTVIIASLIVLALVYGMRRYWKQKGSCGDCQCSCPIKTELQQQASLKD